MAKLIWDAVGERLFETGVSNGVLFVVDQNGAYGAGVPWNGLTGITETPSGAEATALFADNIKYLSLISAEDFGATIEAYTYPDEFMVCDGTATLVAGLTAGQQARSMFGMCFKTMLGNDVDGDAHGYKLHIIYGAKAAPSERAFKTINDSPEAITFSWEITTTPLAIEGYRNAACLVIDSTKADEGALSDLEDLLYGTDGTPGTTSELPTIAEIIALLTVSP